MGTYTTNYNLFMPSVGEQGWGELVNGNFSTIDTTMAGMNTRIGTLETETDTFEERIAAIENYTGTHVITVTPSSNVLGGKGSIDFPVCPYIPGIHYTGSANKISSNTGNGTFFILSSNGTWTTNDSQTVTFTNVLAVHYHHYNPNVNDGLYLPIYSHEV